MQQLPKYAGVGSRNISDDIFQLMNYIGYELAKNGYVLRSGNASGSDYAFASGVERYCNEINVKYTAYEEIYLPWTNFNKETIQDTGYYVIDHKDADNLARKYHPKYDQLSKGAKALIKRNGYQVLGKNLDDPVNMIICWTPDGSIGITTKNTGGTGHAVRMAYDLNIPIFNLYRIDHIQRIENWIKNKCNYNLMEEI